MRTHLTPSQTIISSSNPQGLFGHPKDEVELTRSFKRLLKLVHPDVNPGDPLAADAVSTLKRQYDAARTLMAHGAWDPRGGTLQRLRTRDGTFAIRYFKAKDFELGKQYVCKSSCIYVFDAPYASLARTGVGVLGSIKYQDEALRAEASRYLPIPVKFAEFDDGRVMVVLERDRRGVALDDLAGYMGGKVPGEHVAWVTSSMYSFRCFVELQGLVHGGIQPRDLFAVPETHTVQFVGGWWYAAKFGERLKAMPNAIKSLFGVKPPTVAERRTDSYAIRAVSRRLLGDGKTPESLRLWYEGVGRSRGTAVSEYHDWEGALSHAGKRRFVQLDVSAGRVYGFND